MLLRGVSFLLLWTCLATPARALSLLAYNVKGNGAADWSTNATQVKAIGRQLLYLQPDIVTFNEIPFDYRWQMTNFVKAYLPGYFLANAAGTDGFICSAIASRYSIVRSAKWLDGVSLVPFGYTQSPSTFTRDLYEAEIAIPGWTQHLHVFTTHLKASSDTNSMARRAAEASAISNYFVNGFLTTNGNRPYVLTGDLNEDILRPPSGSLQPIRRLTNAAVGLRLTTPRNPISNDDRTWSIQSLPLTIRFDYILPGGLLFSNIMTNQVFRSDLLSPTPPGLFAADSSAASDHLPVMTVFFNPYDTVFQLTSLTISNSLVKLDWQTTPGRRYRVEGSSNLISWPAVSGNLYAVSNSLTWTTNQNASGQFFRVYRLP